MLVKDMIESADFSKAEYYLDLDGVISLLNLPYDSDLSWNPATRIFCVPIATWECSYETVGHRLYFAKMDDGTNFPFAHTFQPYRKSSERFTFLGDENTFTIMRKFILDRLLDQALKQEQNTHFVVSFDTDIELVDCDKNKLELGHNRNKRCDY